MKAITIVSESDGILNTKFKQERFKGFTDIKRLWGLADTANSLYTYRSKYVCL